MNHATSTSPTEPNRDEIREMLLADFDVPEAIVHYATEGLIDTSDLWWLYDVHRIMATGDAWLLVMMWEYKLNDLEAELLENPSFWEWFDRGRRI